MGWGGLACHGKTGQKNQPNSHIGGQQADPLNLKKNEKGSKSVLFLSGMFVFLFEIYFFKSRICFFPRIFFFLVWCLFLS
jgi:hypothetical protein